MSQITRTVLSSAARVARNNTRAGHSHAPAFRPATMNELPAPAGSWQEYNSAMQRKYNLHLLLGIVFAVATGFAGYGSGSFYLNSGPVTRNN